MYSERTREKMTFLRGRGWYYPEQGEDLGWKKEMGGKTFKEGSELWKRDLIAYDLTIRNKVA